MTPLYRKDLNLGCGDFYSSQYLGVGIEKDSFARLYHDLDAPYLPFKDKCVRFVLLSATIAHVKNPEHLIDECKRVATEGIGIIPCGKQCRHYNEKYSKVEIIYLTEDNEAKLRCKDKLNEWIKLVLHSLKSKEQRGAATPPHQT